MRLPRLGVFRIRWAIERQTDYCRKTLQVLLESLDNESRQYFEQGVKCYEAGEYELAKERFELALKANRTNHFAYEYLGFVAVTKDAGAEAVRNFELARKFADDKPLRALACTHLARAHYASGDRAKAVTFAAEAAQLQPDAAAYSYRYAQYCALAGAGQDALTALSRAWNLDMMYWPKASVDEDFGGLRQDVLRIQKESRSAFRAAAQLALGELERVIQDARRIPLGSISTYEAAGDKLKTQLNEENVFVLLEARSQAAETKKRLVADCEAALLSQVRDKRREIDENRQHDREQLKESQRGLRGIEKEIQELDASEKEKDRLRGDGWVGVRFFLFLGNFQKPLLMRTNNFHRMSVCCISCRHEST